MRRLHTVAKHEKFVASGLYTCFESGSANGLREQWSMHEIGGAQFIRVDVDGRDYDGYSILAEALMNPAGGFERIDQHHYAQANSKPRKMHYTFFDDHVELVSTLGEQRFEDRVTMPAGFGLLSSSWLLTGLMIRQAGKITLLRVDVQVDHFQWSRVEAEANLLGLETIDIGGQEFAASCYQWRQETTVCVDPYGVLLRAETPGTHVRLSHYARRPEHKSS